MPYLTPDIAPGTEVCWALVIPNTPEWLALVSGALLELTQAYNFEQYGTATPAETAAVFRDMLDGAVFREWKCGVIGTIFIHALATLPADALNCDGTLYNRVDYPLLYAAIDPVYHIDADHFRTPNLRGRVVVGEGNIGGHNWVINETAGSEFHTLTTAELPAHSHSEITATATVIAIGAGAPAPSAVPGIGVTGNTGSGTQINIMNPYKVERFAIWAK